MSSYVKQRSISDMSIPYCMVILNDIFNTRGTVVLVEEASVFMDCKQNTDILVHMQSYTPHCIKEKNGDTMQYNIAHRFRPYNKRRDLTSFTIRCVSKRNNMTEYDKILTMRYGDYLLYAHGTRENVGAVGYWVLVDLHRLRHYMGCCKHTPTNVQQNKNSNTAYIAFSIQECLLYDSGIIVCSNIPYVRQLLRTTLGCSSWS